MWLRRMRSRRTPSIVATTSSPSPIVPLATWQRCNTSMPAGAYCVSVTLSTAPGAVVIVPVSPTWPPDSA
ncbi:MAG: hypothetical protein KatS3mg010_0620 [Acidimicrobiia bacterium]|nr:MAG: hypothetical protein KatS3mg010_0620 [Acidimicrobiia bacterium]